jgi:tRNA (mo5U34)-methyltransferase
VFISEEVEIFSGDYLNNPFGSKKDKRIDNWLSILNKLPLIKEVNVNLQNQVSVDFQCEDMLEIEELILQLLPWRKGPFKLNDINIDSEWDSSKKWIRFKELELDLQDKTILDVGSGNGYYAFRMIGDGADQVLCLEPNLVHVSQFASINHFVGSKKIRMVPERLENSGLRNTNFDLIFSMGLLYHQRK